MDKEVIQLEQVLVNLLDVHRRLLQLIQEKVGALKKADHRRVAELLIEENRQMQLIGELEKQRLLLSAVLTKRLNDAAKEPLRLLELAQKMEEPVRGRWLVYRVQLREVMQEIRNHGEVARRSSEALVKHMQGLMQTVGAVVTGVGVYGRTGRAPQATMAVSTFEMKV